MKTRITRYILTAVTFTCLAGAPALFAGDRYERADLRHDYSNLARQNADIRADQWKLHEDLEHRRYWQADRDRADLNRDLNRRDGQVRDIRRDQRDWR